jgi:hypothetical protein
VPKKERNSALNNIPFCGVANVREEIVVNAA